jgi:hypothetical protein
MRTNKLQQRYEKKTICGDGITFVMSDSTRVTSCATSTPRGCCRTLPLT